MEVITKLFCRAADQGYLMPIGNCTSVQRISVYADNVVLFFKPEVTDLVAVRELLRIFGQASGLQVNLQQDGSHDDQGRCARQALGHDFAQLPDI
jgi:hypothetical protein